MDFWELHVCLRDACGEAHSSVMEEQLFDVTNPLPTRSFRFEYQKYTGLEHWLQAHGFWINSLDKSNVFPWTCPALGQ